MVALFVLGVGIAGLMLCLASIARVLVRSGKKALLGALAMVAMFVAVIALGAYDPNQVSDVRGAFAHRTLAEDHDRHLRWRANPTGLNAPGVTPDVAFADSSTRLFDGPGVGHRVLRTIHRDEKVVLAYKELPFQTEEERRLRRGDWVMAAYRGGTGWIDGRLFRVPGAWDQDRFWHWAWRNTVRFLFPEEGVWRKLLGFLGGVAIAFGLSLVARFIPKVVTVAYKVFDYLRMFAPGVYYMRKAMTLHVISRDEVAILCLVYASLGVLLSMVTDILAGHRERG